MNDQYAERMNRVTWAYLALASLAVGALGFLAPVPDQIHLVGLLAVVFLAAYATHPMTNPRGDRDV